MLHGTRDQVILVDENDHDLGKMSKTEAHLAGVLHRAFSIFIYRPNGDLLLQQRAFDKYHSGGLWTNTCCSHPQPGEDTLASAHERLKEEMGISCDLKFRGKIRYHCTFDNGFQEHELDYIFSGMMDDGQVPSPNPAEVAQFEWLSPAELKRRMEEKPEAFTFWFRKLVNEGWLESDQMLREA